MKKIFEETIETNKNTLQGIMKNAPSIARPKICDDILQAGMDEIDQIIASSRFDATKPHPVPEPIISIENKPVFSRDNFSMVVGLPGSRKSFYMSAIMGCLLGGEWLSMERNGDNLNVLWIDTEQADGDVGIMSDRIHKMTNQPNNINLPNLHVYMLRAVADAAKRREVFRKLMKNHQPDFVIIDGATDLIADSNDGGQSNGLIGEFLALTAIYHCHLTTVIHSNVGANKARGHVGSEALRKCETAIYLEVDKHDPSVTNATFIKTRHIRPSDFSFKVENGLPMLASQPNPKHEDSSRKWLYSTILGDEKMKHKQLVTALMESLNTSEENAKKKDTKGQIRRLHHF